MWNARGGGLWARRVARFVVTTPLTLSLHAGVYLGLRSRVRPAMTRRAELLDVATARGLALLGIDAKACAASSCYEAYTW